MSLFSEFIKPPPSIQLPAFGLDISDNSLKYVELAETPAGLRLGTFGSAEIPEGIITSGIIKKEEALGAVLKNVFSQKRGMTYASLSLPEEQGFVRLIRIPRVPLEEVEETISLQLEEHIPLNADEAIFDFRTLSPIKDDTHLNVLVVAFPRAIVETYKNAALAGGLTPVALEIESQAIERVVVPRGVRGHASFIVDIGLTRTSFVIAKDGLAQLTSTIAIGGKHIHEAIAKTMNVDMKKAELLKVEFGVAHTPEGKKVFDAVGPLLATMQEEIRRRIEFWRTSTPHADGTGAVDHVYLCGGDSNLIGLTQYMSSKLHIPVSLANVWVNIVTDPTYVPEITFRESLAYTTCLGLALGARTGNATQLS